MCRAACLLSWAPAHHGPACCLCLQVHIGACVASLVCSWEPWFLNQAAKKNAAAAADASSGSAGRGADGSGRRTASGQLPQQEEGRENGSRSYRTVGAGREEKKEALGVIMKVY